MAPMNKSAKVKSSDKKVVEYKSQSNIITKSFEEGIQLDMKEMMKYYLTSIPYCIGTADGFLSKTNKSKSSADLVKDVKNGTFSGEREITIEDGNAHFFLSIKANPKQLRANL